MTQYDNTNRGSIWPNKRKERETHPDFTGSINVDGRDYWLNGWRRKEGASPESPSMTFSVRPKEGGPSRQEAVAANGNPPAADLKGRGEFNDEIPFLMEWR